MASVSRVKVARARGERQRSPLVVFAGGCAGRRLAAPAIALAVFGLGFYGTLFTLMQLSPR
jgi:hypothetical protein